MDEKPPPSLLSLEHRFAQIRELQKAQVVESLRGMADDIENGITTIVDFEIDVDVRDAIPSSSIGSMPAAQRKEPGNITLRIVVGDPEKNRPFAGHRRPTPKEEPTP